jgi:hypothetical protein
MKTVLNQGQTGWDREQCTPSRPMHKVHALGSAHASSPIRGFFT